MVFRAKYERWHTLARWMFVLYFLLTPRVVVHRHADVPESNAGSLVLATHLDHWHSSQECSFPECQFHFHLSFALLPIDVPAGTTANSDAPTTSDTTTTILADLGKALLHSYVRTVPDVDTATALPLSVGFETRRANDLRRIFFGVWQI